MGNAKTKPLDTLRLPQRDEDTWSTSSSNPSPTARRKSVVAGSMLAIPVNNFSMDGEDPAIHTAIKPAISPKLERKEEVFEPRADAKDDIVLSISEDKGLDDSTAKPSPVPPADTADAFLSSQEPIRVTLQKDHGFGISFIGPKPDLAGIGIYITHIAPGSVAEKSGSLCRGQKIVEINSRNVEQFTRQECSSLLKNAPDTLELLVRYDPRGFAQYDFGVELRRASMTLLESLPSKAKEAASSADKENSPNPDVTLKYLGFGALETGGESICEEIQAAYTQLPKDFKKRKVLIHTSSACITSTAKDGEKSDKPVTSHAFIDIIRCDSSGSILAIAVNECLSAEEGKWALRCHFYSAPSQKRAHELKEELARLCAEAFEHIRTSIITTPAPTPMRTLPEPPRGSIRIHVVGSQSAIETDT